MQNYKKLKVWDKAHKFTLRIYEATKSFPKDEIFGLTNQLRRAITSIPTNIAEGTGRKGNVELTRFLHISLGSANEAEYQIFLAKELKYINQNQYKEFFEEISEIKRMLVSLIKKTSNSKL